MNYYSLWSNAPAVPAEIIKKLFQLLRFYNGVLREISYPTVLLPSVAFLLFLAFAVRFLLVFPSRQEVWALWFLGSITTWLVGLSAAICPSGSAPGKHDKKLAGD
jgi:hypothetical protein